MILAVFLNPNKDLRLPFNYLVVNLSLADLVVGLIAAPLGLAYHFLRVLESLINPLEKRCMFHFSFPALLRF